MKAELAVLFLCAASGLCGYMVKSVTLTIVTFLAGLAVYLISTMPNFVPPESLRDKEAEAKEIAKLKAQAEAQAARATSMPTAEEALKLIKTRRAVYPKDYTGDKVPKEKVQQILEAARWAPTHGLTEPWR